MNTIPVILIHNGNNDYLRYSLLQAQKNNKVYLIGNINPQIDGIDFFNINDFLHGFDIFKSNYVHLNTTPYDYELFCYARWFILQNFISTMELDIVFYIDSDVLLFVDVNNEWQKFKQYDFTLLHRTAAISSFITKEGLDNFCSLLNNVYSNKNDYAFKKIESHFNVRQLCGLPGGVCDMTLLEYFHYDSSTGGGPGKVGEMMQIIDNTTYDHNINAKDQNFSFVNGMKDIKIIDKLPYVYSEKLNLYVKFNSLHFQGQSKYLMKKIYEQCN